MTLFTHMAGKYPVITQMYSPPPPRSEMMERNAVDVMVASSAVNRPAKPIATIRAQNLTPGLNGTGAAGGGGLTADEFSSAGPGSERRALGSDFGLDIIPVDGCRPRVVEWREW